MLRRDPYTLFEWPGSASRCKPATCAPTDPDVQDYRIRFLEEWFRYL